MTETLFVLTYLKSTEININVIPTNLLLLCHNGVYSVLYHRTVVMAPVVGGAIVGTILPLLTATILSYCITGYIRDVLFGEAVKKCIGPSCNALVSQCL